MKLKLYNVIFKQYWNPYVAMGLAGLFCALYFELTGTVWAVTGEFTRFGGHIVQWFGVDVSEWAYFDLIGIAGSPLSRSDGWIVIGMLFGALITVLLSSSFKIRMPKQKRRLVQGFIGGIIAGFGARLAMGCNLAAFFTGVPQFSFHAWIFMIMTGVGTYLGVKVVRTKWWLGKADIKKTVMKKAAVKKKEKKKIQPIIGLLVALVYIAIILYFFLTGNTILGIGALFGAIFGILIERGQICFTSAFRDLWISGRTVMAKAIAFGMIIATVLTFITFEMGADQVIKVAAPSTVLGGLLFGFGIVLAGGCETGMMYRMMEGQVLYLVVGVGNVLGATLLSYGWDHWGIFDALAAGWPKVNLITELGAYPALIGTIVLLLAWYGYTVWWGKNFRYGTGMKKAS